ncbi:UDP-N-acetylglucosamine 2-epimerase [Gammaproteobacteria bacterium]|nr:UDP-N-acetylglucosamine 2-epimerase [Gammaproteobacteria bacterium]
MKYLFITGTRADFGKMKNLISKIIKTNSNDSVEIVATGMHLLPQFGNTIVEVESIFPGKVKAIDGQRYQENMSLGFARFIVNFNHHIEKNIPDIVIVHGDRFDALGAAIVASNLDIHVIHIEGGEVSGTIDEAIRHSVTKFSHVHLVSNKSSKARVEQLGENPAYTFVTGSPETDVLLGSDLPSLESVRLRYDINFDTYNICCFHPVTSEKDDIPRQIKELVEFAEKSNENFIWIYPNNDIGGTDIIKRLKLIKSNRIKVFESLRFESYITLLKNSKCIIGNSSSGVREAHVLNVPCVNIGSRQSERVKHSLIFECNTDIESIRSAYENAINSSSLSEPVREFGSGNVVKNIKEILDNLNLEEIPIQKKFHGF